MSYADNDFTLPDPEPIQLRLEQRLAIALQDDQDVVDLIALAAWDLLQSGDLRRGTPFAEVQGAVRDWLES